MSDQDFIIVQTDNQTVYAGPLSDLTPSSLPPSRARYNALVMYTRIHNDVSKLLVSHFFVRTADDLQDLDLGRGYGLQPRATTIASLDNKVKEAIKKLLD